jgi:RNA polymerase sigma factor for flagellar operon FliA
MQLVAMQPARPGRNALKVNELWTAYAAGSEIAREALLTQHLGLVHFVARQVFRTLSSEVDFDELVSAGTLGLIGALESFDRSRGLAFSTFAAPRIRGSILDELRRQDHVSRSVRRKARMVNAAREALMRTLGREPLDDELAAQLDLDLPSVWRWKREIEGAMLVSIERPSDGAGDRSAAPGDLLAGDGPGIDELLNHEQEVGLLAVALAALGEQQRIVLTLHYYEELKLSEIAAVLGVTESRVSQIRSKALARLRAEMAPQLDAVA